MPTDRMPMRHCSRSFRAAVGAVLVIVAACSGDGKGGVEPTQDGDEIRMSASAFLRSDLTVRPGTTVRWVNSSGTYHDVVSETGAWQPAALPNLQSFEFTFTTRAYTDIAAPRTPLASPSGWWAW